MSDIEQAWFYYLNEDGVTEACNAITGEVRLSEVPSAKRSEYRVIDVNGRAYFVPNDGLPSSPVAPTTREYSTMLAEQFCIKLAEGAPIQDTCKRLNISYSTFCRWRKRHPEFADMVEQALRDRGTFVFERLLKLAEETPAERDEVALAKLKAEIYKSVAAISDERYNPKTKIEGDLRVGVVAVETGIRRAGDPGFTERDVNELITPGAAVLEEKE